MDEEPERMPLHLPWPFADRRSEKGWLGEFRFAGFFTGHATPGVLHEQPPDDYFTFRFGWTKPNAFYGDAAMFVALFDCSYKITTGHPDNDTEQKKSENMSLPECRFRIALPDNNAAELDRLLGYPVCKKLLALKLQNLKVYIDDWSTFRLVPMQKKVVSNRSRRYTTTWYYNDSGVDINCDNTLNYDARKGFSEHAAMMAHFRVLDLALIFANTLPAYVLLEVLQRLPLLCEHLQQKRVVALCQRVKESCAALRCEQSPNKNLKVLYFLKKPPRVCNPNSHNNDNGGH